MIGRVVGGNFRLVRKIGAGAMGDVYQAEQRSLGKMVAVKLLRPEFMADEKLIRRFELEARSASSLDHPNSIQIIDFGREDGLLFIAMELLSGSDLAQLVNREGALPIARAARVMDQVLAALDEAHAQGIVHRDLKPGNIMLVPRRGEPDFVKVCDFGIAKVPSAPEGAMLTMKGLICGTPEYMSPEQARGEPVDGRSDLYAVSIILYQLLTGEIPFSASSPVGILSKHLTEPPRAPSSRRREVPPSLDALVLQGLAKDPDDRPQTAADYRACLRTAVDHLVASWPGQGTPRPGSMAALPSRGSTTAETLPMTDACAPQAAPVLSTGSTAERHARVKRLPRVLARVALLGGAAAVALFLLAPRVKVALEGRAVGTRGRAASDVAGRASTEASGAPAPLPPLVPADRRSAPGPADPQVGDPDLPDRAAEADFNRPAVRAAGRPRPERRPTGRAATPSRPSARERPQIEAQPADAPGDEAGMRSAQADPASADAAPTSAAVSPSGAAWESIKEAERLLAHGDAAGACRRAEEAERLAPKIPAIHRLLGKCHMRRGEHDRARESYRHYLELAPDASDAAFIRSIVK